MLDYTYYKAIMDYLEKHPWDRDLSPFRKVSIVDLRRMAIVPLTSKGAASDTVCGSLQHANLLFVVQFTGSDTSVEVKMAKVINLK